jgi:hypothetical protein
MLLEQLMRCAVLLLVTAVQKSLKLTTLNNSKVQIIY